MSAGIIRQDIWLRDAGPFLAEKYQLALQDARPLIEAAVRSGRATAERIIRGRAEQLSQAYLATVRFDHAEGTITRALSRAVSYQDTADEGDELEPHGGFHRPSIDDDDPPGDPIRINLPQLCCYVEEVVACARPTAVPARNTGGAPRQIHWDQLHIEAAGWVFENGLPDPHTLLINYLADWYSERYGRQIDVGEIRKRIVKPLIDRCKS